MKKLSPNQKFVYFSILIPFLFGALGALATVLVFNKIEDKAETRMKNFYADEMATVIGATALKGMIDKKDESYVLVDLRSKAEYDKEHMVTAINIPATSLSADEVIAEFEKLPKDKTLIIHCYSAYCTLGRKIGELLSKNGIYAKELTVGWSEWRYFWDIWNPGASKTDGAKYIEKGTGSSNTLPAPCTEGEFGC